MGQGGEGVQKGTAIVGDVLRLGGGYNGDASAGKLLCYLSLHVVCDVQCGHSMRCCEPMRVIRDVRY